eukprot:gene23786-25351_t
MANTPDIDFVSMPLNPYALGMVLEFVTRYPPFATFEAGTLVNAVSFQLGTGSNLLASRQDQLVGYLGWIPTTLAVGQAWMRSSDILVPADNADTAAITILAVADPALMQPMIRVAKTRYTFRHVVWRRYYQDGRGDRVRRLERRTLENLTEATPE